MWRPGKTFPVKVDTAGFRVWRNSWVEPAARPMGDVLAQTYVSGVPGESYVVARPASAYRVHRCALDCP